MKINTFLQLCFKFQCLSRYIQTHFWIILLFPPSCKPQCHGNVCWPLLVIFLGGVPLPWVPPPSPPKTDCMSPSCSLTPQITAVSCSGRREERATFESEWAVVPTHTHTHSHTHAHTHTHTRLLFPPYTVRIHLEPDVLGELPHQQMLWSYLYIYIKRCVQYIHTYVVLARGLNHHHHHHHHHKGSIGHHNKEHLLNAPRQLLKFQCKSCFRIHWAPISSSLSPYGCIYISPSHIINSLWLHVS